MVSDRAAAASNNGKALFWEILPNLWNPKTNPDGYVSLGVAENSLMYDELSAHLHKHMHVPDSAFTYGDGVTGTKRLRSAVARFLNRRLHPVQPLDPEQDIVITNGCSAAVEQLSWALANPGEGILLGQPYYGTFKPDLTLRMGSVILPVPFGELDPLGLDAVTCYEKVLLEAQSKGTKVAALLISNPHNPLGRCYSRDVLAGLLRLCAKHKIHLISDEIYALSVFENDVDKPEPTPFESVLSIDVKNIIDPSFVHVLWGMSKDFGANGIRIGALISQNNKTLHDAVGAAALYSSASSLSEHVAANILEDDAFADSYVKTNQQRLAEQYRLASAWAQKNGIEYSTRVNAAFFMWLDLGKFYRKHHDVPETDDITEVVMQKLLQNKVFIASGKDFGSEKPGWFRIVFSQKEAILREGLDRIITALQ